VADVFERLLDCTVHTFMLLKTHKTEESRKSYHGTVSTCMTMLSLEVTVAL